MKVKGNCNNATKVLKYLILKVFIKNIVKNIAQGV